MANFPHIFTHFLVLSTLPFQSFPQKLTSVQRTHFRAHCGTFDIRFHHPGASPAASHRSCHRYGHSSVAPWPGSCTEVHGHLASAGSRSSRWQTGQCGDRPQRPVGESRGPTCAWPAAGRACNGSSGPSTRPAPDVAGSAAACPIVRSPAIRSSGWPGPALPAEDHLGIKDRVRTKWWRLHFRRPTQPDLSHLPAFIKKLEQSLYCSELKNRLLLELVFKIFTILSIFFSSIFAQFKTTEIFFFLNRSIGQIKNNSYYYYAKHTQSYKKNNRKSLISGEITTLGLAPIYRAFWPHLILHSNPIGRTKSTSKPRD